MFVLFLKTAHEGRMGFSLHSQKNRPINSRTPIVIGALTPADFQGNWLPPNNRPHSVNTTPAIIMKAPSQSSAASCCDFDILGILRALG